MKTEQLVLSSRHRHILESLLNQYLPDVEVWVYGSRVNGKSHRGSDLDLVLRGPGLESISREQLSAFMDAVSDSSIPFLVDARDWARLPKHFRANIESEHVAFCDATRKTH